MVRTDAIAHLTLPWGLHSPAVGSEAAAPDRGDPKVVLTAAYQDLAVATRLVVTQINAKVVAIESQLEILAGQQDVNINNIFQTQIMLNQLSQVSQATTNILTAYSSAVAVVAHDVK